MRPGATAATAGADDVDPEAGLGVAGGMGAAVVLREQLDVLVVFAPVDLVLDAVVGEVDLAVEVRQVVFARPVADLVLVAVRSAVAVGAVRGCAPAGTPGTRASGPARGRRAGSRGPPCSSRSRASSCRYVA